MGRGRERSKIPILSRPRKPPEKMFLPRGSFLLTHLERHDMDPSSRNDTGNGASYSGVVGENRDSKSSRSKIVVRLMGDIGTTHQVKLSISFWKHLAKNWVSRSCGGPVALNTFFTAQA